MLGSIFAHFNQVKADELKYTEIEAQQYNEKLVENEDQQEEQPAQNMNPK